MITLRRATNQKDVELILKDPEIFSRIAEDGHDIDSYNVNMDNCYMLVCNQDKIIGVWCLYPINKSTLNIHCNILKEFREHGKEAGRLILKWFIEECPRQYQKLNAEIPTIYPEVYHYTKKQGLIDEGINRLSIMKNGKLVDQWRLGITRAEVNQEIV